MAWGEVAAAEVVDGVSIKDTEKRFDRFMESVLAGRIVPLLGAGASADSVPTCMELLAKLKEHVTPPFNNGKAREGDVNRLAETIQWCAGAEAGALKLCRILGIADWAERPPTRAHRYIALLACDGLIGEVITTNYDCGLEKAWREANSGDVGEWKAITCAEDYFQPRLNNGRPQPRVVKLNGCARRLRDAKGKKRREWAGEILLTDLQLQQFGRRQWARDEFRVVLRANELVFSGFGSEEPQIWHIVMDILGEFETLKSEGVRKAPSLWVPSFKGKLSFPVLQALEGEKRTRPGTPRKFDNVFFESPRGKQLFGGSEKGKLDAGDFWRKVWVEALRQRIDDLDGRVARAFFRHVLGHPYRRRDHPSQKLAGLWSTIVENAFDHSEIWLREPTRTGAVGISEWSPKWSPKGRKRPPMAMTQCAPGPCCVRLPDGGTRYVPIEADPDFWLAILLFPTAISEEGAALRGYDAHEGRMVAFVRGSGGLTVAHYGPVRDRVLTAREGDDRRSMKLKIVLLLDEVLERGVVGMTFGEFERRLYKWLVLARHAEAKARVERRIPAGAA